MAATFFGLNLINLSSGCSKNYVQRKSI